MSSLTSVFIKCSSRPIAFLSTYLIFYHSFPLKNNRYYPQQYLHSAKRIKIVSLSLWELSLTSFFGSPVVRFILHLSYEQFTFLGQLSKPSSRFPMRFKVFSGNHTPLQSRMTMILRFWRWQERVIMSKCKF